MKLLYLFAFLGLASFVQAAVYIPNPNKITLESKDCSRFGSWVLRHLYCHECRNYIYNNRYMNNEYKNCIDYWIIFNSYGNKIPVPNYLDYFKRDVEYKKRNSTVVKVKPMVRDNNIPDAGVWV